MRELSKRPPRGSEPERKRCERSRHEERNGLAKGEIEVATSEATRRWPASVKPAQREVSKRRPPRGQTESGRQDDDHEIRQSHPATHPGIHAHGFSHGPGAGAVASRLFVILAPV